jgi:hypothetical protein
MTIEWAGSRSRARGQSRPKALLPLALLFLILPGCSFLLLGLEPSDPFASTSERRVTVRIENLTSEDVNVRALGSGRRNELGRIRARSIQQFSVPLGSTRDLRFQLELTTGGRGHTTQSIPVAPGDQINLFVGLPLNRSQVRR